MSIQDALKLADQHANTQNMSDEVWALRVLAGAYRREKQISENRITKNTVNFSPERKMIFKS
jgi:hypothetical protein